VLLTQSLAFLDVVDPTWAAATIVPRLAWERPDAAALWHARAADFGSSRLFNRLKPAMLEAFENNFYPSTILGG